MTWQKSVALMNHIKVQNGIGIFSRKIQLHLLEQERGMPIEVSNEGKLDWTPVREHVKQYGMRNSNTMAIAPTATISNIAGCFPCIEPIYKNIYVKSNMSGEFTVVNKYLGRRS